MILLLFSLTSQQEDPGAKDQPDTDDFDDREINPRFRIMDPAIPNPQLGEFLAVRQKNMAKGAKVEVPVFDPNKHPGNFLLLTPEGCYKLYRMFPWSIW